MTNKEINAKISNILNLPKLYDLRCELRIVNPDLTFEEAQAFYNKVEPEHKHLYAITSCQHSLPFSEDVSEALKAAKKISEKNNDTFVLSIEDGQWKACYGSYNSHEEYIGANPAYVTCMSIIRFMESL